MEVRPSLIIDIHHDRIPSLLLAGCCSSSISHDEYASRHFEVWALVLFGYVPERMEEIQYIPCVWPAW